MTRAPMFVMPRTPREWSGAGALWLTVAGWAAAEERRGGVPRILTPNGLMSASECIDITASAPSVSARRKWPGPQWARQMVRDGQRALKGRNYSREYVEFLESTGSPVTGYVWQHHELFHRTGSELSRRFDVPLIEFVHAPVVWEAKRWGVHRPGSASLVERFGERPQLTNADLVACVSEEVQHQVIRMGVPIDRTVVAPMGVDIDRFSPDVDSHGWADTTRSLGDVVLGWAGSVRRFHNVDVAFHAVRNLRARGYSVGLAIAGDGQDRPRLEALVAELDIGRWVRFIGQVPNAEMPGFLASLDIAVLTAGANQAFHYSPLKLREYLAMGLPVIAPRVGELSRFLDDGVTGVLYEPGDAAGLSSAVLRIAENDALRHQLGRAGRTLIASSGSWDAISTMCLDRLNVS